MELLRNNQDETFTKKNKLIFLLGNKIEKTFRDSSFTSDYSTFEIFVICHFFDTGLSFLEGLVTEEW